MSLRRSGSSVLLLVVTTACSSPTSDPPPGETRADDQVACTAEGSPSGVTVDDSAYDLAALDEGDPRSLEVGAEDAFQETGTAYGRDAGWNLSVPLPIEETPDQVTVVFRVRESHRGAVQHESTLTVATRPVTYGQAGPCQRRGRWAAVRLDERGNLLPDEEAPLLEDLTPAT